MYRIEHISKTTEAISFTLRKKNTSVYMSSRITLDIKRFHPRPSHTPTIVLKTCVYVLPSRNPSLLTKPSVPGKLRRPAKGGCPKPKPCPFVVPGKIINTMDICMDLHGSYTVHTVSCRL